MSERKVVIAPSLLACDLSNISSESSRICQCGADWLHYDVMVRLQQFLVVYSFDTQRFMYYQDGCVVALRHKFS